MDDRTCAVNGCMRNGKLTRGLCRMHYARWLRHGAVGGSKPSCEPRYPAGTRCSAPECERPVRARGWCATHHQRWRLHGDAQASVPVIGGDAATRFWDKVTISGPDDCWLWTGAKISTGYGSFRRMGRRSELAHRVSYELLVGQIPYGLTLDHVYERGCRNRHCVNPGHLEPVTIAENNRRARESQQRKESA